MKKVFSNPLFYLFLCNFAIVFIGMGLFPILPLYAAQFGASSSWIGLYLGITYLSITIGTMTAGWLADRFGRKPLFVAAGLAGIPAVILLGQVSAFWQVIVLTSAVWFTGGIGLTLASVYTGLIAEKTSRGKSFGIMNLATPLGAILGGAAVGQLVDWKGYPLMFALVALVWAIWPATALLKVKDVSAPAPAIGSRSETKTSSGFGLLFTLLLVAALLSALTISIGRLGVSLSMKTQMFTAGAVSSANMFGGMVTIPAVLLIGSLSDRSGRKLYLGLTYLIAAGGMVMLNMANELWHFWAASAMIMVAMSTGRSIASAMATDILAPESLGRGLPWLNGMNWMSGVLGFAGAGFIYDNLGATILFLGAAVASLIAAVILHLLPASQEKDQSGQSVHTHPHIQEVGC